MNRLIFFILKVLFFGFFFLNFLEITKKKGDYLETLTSNFQIMNMLYSQLKGRPFFDQQFFEPENMEIMLNHIIFSGITLSVLFLMSLNLCGMILPFIYFFQKFFFDHLKEILGHKNDLNKIRKLFLECIILFVFSLYFISIRKRRPLKNKVNKN